MTSSSGNDSGGSTPFGFGAFAPGFDFFQSLAKGAAQGLPQIPGLSNWVTPTLDPEELDKRIQELKTVQFWLEQNARTIAATVQALEVQKLTLATLKGLNVSAHDLAQAFTVRPPSPAAAEPAAPPPAAAAPEPAAPAAAAATEAPAAGPSLIDPTQWWSQLTQQFQQIASTALQDAARATVPPVAAPAARAAAAAKKPAARKAPAKPAATRRKAGG